MTDSLTYEEKVALLEELYLATPPSVEYNPYGNSQYLDVAIATVAKYTPVDTVFDILKAEDIRVNEFLALAIDEVVQLWLDVEAIKNSERNLLNISESTDWKTDYHHQLAEYLVANGQAANLRESFYGWEDCDIPTTLKPVAVLSVFTEGWAEFVHTFTDAEEKVGIAGIVVYENGKTRKMRHESDFTEVIRSITT